MVPIGRIPFENYGVELRTGLLGDARQHAGADFVAVVEREDDVGPPLTGERPVRAGATQLAPKSAASTADSPEEDEHFNACAPGTRRTSGRLRGRWC